MADGTGIEWTDASWNPSYGCNRVSEGCRHCYAETMAARVANAAQARLRGEVPLTPIQEAYRQVVRWKRGGRSGPADLDDVALPAWNGKAVFVPDQLALPLRWTRPRRIFVNSMSDLFHESIPFEQVAAVFGVMAACPQHTFQVLTKRPERAREFFEWLREAAEDVVAGIGAKPPEGGGDAAACVMCAEPLIEGFGPFRGPLDGAWAAGIKSPWPLPNVWLGVSVEDQATADERLPFLEVLPAAVRWVSYEPALGPVDFERVPRALFDRTAAIKCAVYGPAALNWEQAASVIAKPFVNWLVVGGESGHGARPLDVAWVRTTRDQCEAAGTPLFFKQCGANVIDSTGLGVNVEAGGWWPSGVRCHVGESFEAPRHIQLRSRKGGDPEEWPADLRVRMFPGEAWP
jgi:protein gp37